jgi:hypothetical protein
MRRFAQLTTCLAGLAATLAASGCGGTSSDTPAACLVGPPSYLRALAAAPRAVRLSGGVPISDCFAENQEAGDLAAVGTALVTATTRLNGEARAHPGGSANVELGYLLGAAGRGAGDTGGIHAELLRRLTTAARYSPENRPLPASFYRAYRSGYAAGRHNG